MQLAISALFIVAADSNG